MEYIDILDEKGNKTGEVKSKDEVHKKGLWHKAVHVWLVNSKNEILLQLRSKNKETYPGLWDISAAGHVSAGETSLESAERETSEELGITVSQSDLMLIGKVTQSVVINNGTFFNNEFNDVYVVRRDINLADFRFNDGEVEEVAWFPKEKFQEMVSSKDPSLVPNREEFALLLNYLK